MTLNLGRNDFFRPNKNVAQTHIKYTKSFAQPTHLYIYIYIYECKLDEMKESNKTFNIYFI